MPELRIAAGEYKGRRLASGSGRPTTGRVREAIFSSLGSDLGSEDIGLVLDLYCGSGAMGLEAVSRGARGAVLVDQDTESAEANVASLGISDRVQVVRGSAVAYLESLATNEFDLIFCDPPYTLAATEMNEIESKLSAVLSPTGRVVVEGPADDGLYLGLPLLFDRTYGRTRVAIHGAGE